MPTKKTLEQLENEFWEVPEFTSHLVVKCHALRKKALKDFGVEDLRIMISQHIGLEHLLPIAFNIIKNDVLAKGDFYPGDLLTAITTIENSFWEKHSQLKQRISDIILSNQDILSANNIDISNFVH
jgi:hypothetical protein